MKLDESKNTLMWNCHGCENMNFEKKVKYFKFQISKIIQSIKIGNLWERGETQMFSVSPWSLKEDY